MKKENESLKGDIWDRMKKEIESLKGDIYEKGNENLKETLEGNENAI